MSMPVYANCVVCGEYKRILGRGACAGDYQTYRRLGWLDKLPRSKMGRPRIYRSCQVCGGPHHRLGLCVKHFMRQRREARLEVVR